MQSADEIDFARKDQACAVRHRWGFCPADNVELNFKIILLGDAAFPKYGQKQQVRGIAGEQGNLTHINTLGFNDHRTAGKILHCACFWKLVPAVRNVPHVQVRDRLGI